MNVLTYSCSLAYVALHGDTFKVRQTYVHPHYQYDAYYHDIALIELGKSNLQVLMN